MIKPSSFYSARNKFTITPKSSARNILLQHNSMHMTLNKRLRNYNTLDAPKIPWKYGYKSKSMYGSFTEYFKKHKTLNEKIRDTQILTPLTVYSFPVKPSEESMERMCARQILKNAASISKYITPIDDNIQPFKEECSIKKDAEIQIDLQSRKPTNTLSLRNISSPNPIYHYNMQRKVNTLYNLPTSLKIKKPKKNFKMRIKEQPQFTME